MCELLMCTCENSLYISVKYFRKQICVCVCVCTVITYGKEEAVIHLLRIPIDSVSLLLHSQ